MRKPPRKPKGGEDDFDAHSAPPSPCNSIALRKAMRNVSALYDETLAPTGLRATQRALLITIDRLNVPTVNQLAEDTKIERTALSRNLRPLQRDGYINIATDKVDKRARKVSITSKGQEKLRQTLALWELAQEAFEQAFGKEDAATLRATLARVAALNFKRKK